MPHINVKLWPGKTEEQKKRLAEEIGRMTTEVLGCPLSSVSVAIEETDKEDWDELVYGPEIIDKSEKIYLEPGYVPDRFKNKEIK